MDQDNSEADNSSSCYTISFSDTSQTCEAVASGPSLQEMFLKYKRKRQAELKEVQRLQEVRAADRCDPEEMRELREKFVAQAKKYIGVPYAKRYWSPDEPEYSEPLFLDCCGLVRQVLYDLKKEFGFKIGSWNQAYQYDTLPITIQNREDMKPGDLVFISATYYNPKSKKQKHDMVHVEIWLGDGDKTLGARWQRGKVQVFDSYMFEAKSYHTPTYIFKSIDTWLQGVCKSHCSEHQWRRLGLYSPGEKSIFHLDDEDTDDEPIEPAEELAEEQEEVEPLENTAEELSEEKERVELSKNSAADLAEEQEMAELAENPQSGDKSFDIGVVVFGTARSVDKTEDLSPPASQSLASPAYSVQVMNNEKEKSFITKKAYSSSAVEDDKSTIEEVTVVKELSSATSLTSKTVKLPLLPSATSLTSPAHSSLISTLNCAFDSTSVSLTSLKICEGEESLELSSHTQGEPNYHTSMDRMDECIRGKSQSLPEYSTTNTTKTLNAFANQTASAPILSAGAPTLKPTSRERRNHARNVQRQSVINLSQPPMASYQICGGNGGHIVDAYLTSLGWKKIVDKQNYNWKFKWLEVNSQVNYGAFKDGEQLVNRIPNCSLLTNKLGLYNSLSEYDRVIAALKGDRVKLKMSDFVPETYRLDYVKDKETFLDVYKDGEIWICKPVGLNQGKGIFLIRSREQVEKMLEEREQRKQQRRTKPLMAMIIQRYIERPLLVGGKKFDIRCYMLIASTVPFLVLYRRGYVRVTCETYDLDSLDLTTHLTNQFVQKKHEDYKDVKEDTVWSMQKFNSYINENVRDEKGIENDWVLNSLEKQIKSIMKFCFNSVKHKLTTRLGLFDIYGLDFMIDENMKIYLIEINVNPAMHVNCDVLKETIPGILHETVDLSLECFEKSKKNQPLMPLQSLRTFQILHNGCVKSGHSQGQGHSSSNAAADVTSSSNTGAQSNSVQSNARASQSPNRTTQAVRRSMSPSKEQNWGYIQRTPMKSSKSSNEPEPGSKSAPQPASTVRSSGTNYIKSNIANLSNPTLIRHRRYGRLSRLDSIKPDQQTQEPTDQSKTEADTPMETQPTNENAEPQQEEVTPVNEQTQELVASTDNMTDSAPYNKQLNSTPVTQQFMAARARGAITTATASSFPPEWKITEQILQELREHRVKPQLLPPLYTIRSDVATSKNPQQQAANLGSITQAEQMIMLQGYPAISNGSEPLNSPVRLSMVHAAYAPGKAKTRTNTYNVSTRRYPRDRAS